MHFQPKMLCTGPITHCILSIFIYMHRWDMNSFKEHKHSLKFSLFTLLISLVLLLKIPECFYHQNGLCVSICLKNFACAFSFLVVDPHCFSAVSAPLQITLTLWYPEPNTMMVKWQLETLEKWQSLLQPAPFSNISDIFLICTGLKHSLHVLLLFFSIFSMISSSQHYNSLAH